MPGIIPGLRVITGVWVPRMMSSIFDVGLCGTSKIPKYMKLETRRNRNKDLQSVEAEMLCSAAVESLDNPISCRNVFPSPNAIIYRQGHTEFSSPTILDIIR